jgi:hypothetical protein
MGHEVIDVKDILNSQKILRSVKKIRSLYEQFLIFLKKSFFSIWREFDKRMLTIMREFEGKMNWGRDTCDNPRFLGVKYGLTSQYKMTFGKRYSY